jgi:hypothetical protein
MPSNLQNEYSNSNISSPQLSNEKPSDVEQNRNRIKNLIFRKGEGHTTNGGNPNRQFAFSRNANKGPNYYPGYSNNRLSNTNTNTNAANEKEQNKNPATNINKVPNVKKNCSECFKPFFITKVESHWKKRCPICQKEFNQKAASLKNYYRYNSYKAGKTNQPCAICKKSFVVPVALIKQRKTCYYCFKATSSKTEI